MPPPAFVRRHAVYDLPLELLLRIASHLEFSDLWYFGLCSRSCQKTAQQLIYHKYHIDLARQRTNSFNHLIHAAVAFVCRHGYDSDSGINPTVIQWVANRLAVEIYDRTPQHNWTSCFDFFLDKMLGIMVDHVLCDASRNELLSPKSRSYKSTRMGFLMTNLLVTLYPTLTALFDAEDASAIHHRLLLAHICRHIDTLTRRYHHQQRRRLILGATTHAATSSCVRHGFRVLVQFIGTLAQTELLTAADLHTLTQQRIIYFFLSNTPTTPPPEPVVPVSSSSSSPLPSPSTSSNSTSTSSTSTTASIVDVKEYFDQHWLSEETEFQSMVLFDLLRAVMCRQYAHSDKDLHTLASLLSETVNALASCSSSSSSSTTPSTATPSNTTTSTTTTATSTLDAATTTKSASSSPSPSTASVPSPPAVVPPPSPVSPSR